MSEKKNPFIELFELVQETSEFADVPVRWEIRKRGARMRVERGVGGVNITINVKSENHLEVVRTVLRALKFANDMHRGLTSASVIGDSSEYREGQEYVPTLGDWKQEMESRELFAEWI